MKITAQKVIDFLAKHECEGCKRRRKKVKAIANRTKRDLMRRWARK